MADPVLRCEGVSHFYGTRSLRTQVLHDIDAEMRGGEVVILEGPSGSGKTTLLTLVGGLRAAQSGSIRVLGQELRAASPARLVAVRRHIGYVFQLHNLLASLNALQNVLMGMISLRGVSRGEACRRALATLESVGLGERARHLPSQLSVGQRQRVAVARALAADPQLVLADEPTASLDRESGREVVEHLRDLAKQRGTAVLLVTHDDRIFDVADRILHLEEGRLRGVEAAAPVRAPRVAARGESGGLR